MGKLFLCLSPSDHFSLAPFYFRHFFKCIHFIDKFETSGASNSAVGGKKVYKWQIPFAPNIKIQERKHINKNYAEIAKMLQ